MAEAAGLVIGGVALASLFDQCMSFINYIDSGINCSPEYQDSALMITLIGCRLNRWEHTFQTAHGQDTTTVEDGENAEHWLIQIRRRLEEAERMGDRYTIDKSAIASVQLAKRPRLVPKLIDELRRQQNTNSSRDSSLSFGKRARWALHDRDKMASLVDKLDRLVSSLEKLFPSLQEQRLQMAKTDIAGLLSSSPIEQEAPDAMGVLKAAAAVVDKDLDVAVTSAASSNTYRDIEVTDTARVNNANYYSEGWARAQGPIGKGGGHSYDGIRISGQARVQNGDIFGGKGVFDD